MIFSNVNNKASVLFGLKFTSHCLAHGEIILRSWFKIPSISGTLRALKAKEESCLQKETEYEKDYQQYHIIIYIKKNKGPNTEP